MVSTGFAVARPNRALLDTQFFKYALREPRFLSEVEARSTGISYPAINSSELADIQIQLPPLSAQKRIATYLDAEISRIDVLTAEKERMLALLEEKRSSQVSRAVTRGLNPRATLKSSGLPWLEEIPEGWNLKRGKLLFQEIDDRTETGEETLLSLRMQRGLVPHDDVSEKPIGSEYLIGYKRVRVGEIVLNRMRAASGLVAVASEDGIVSPDYAVFSTIGDIDPHYFVALFKTQLLQAVFRALSKGLGTGSSGFLRLYSEDFLAATYPVPPVSPTSEQAAIVAHLIAERERTAALEEALRSSIELLHERRRALITATVTGHVEPEDIDA